MVLPSPTRRRIQEGEETRRRMLPRPKPLEGLRQPGGPVPPTPTGSGARLPPPKLRGRVPSVSCSSHRLDLMVADRAAAPTQNGEGTREASRGHDGP